MKFLNWLLYQLHRWIGLVLSLFMFFWFLTGVVIMYSTPTTQTRSDQLAHAEALAPEIGWLSLGDAWERSAEQRRVDFEKHKPKAPEGDIAPKQASGDAKSKQVSAIVDARLVRIAGKPVWLVEDSRDQRFALSAIDGSLQETSSEQALKIAQSWLSNPQATGEVKVDYLETIEKPIILRNQDALRPFHRIAFGEAGGELLISSRTGEVLHASSRTDRGFFWAGNWLHLFKPLESIGLGNIRHDVQVWLGFFATIATLTGLIIGWLRWRPGFGGKKTYSEGRTQPYRETWFKWHFWSGLLGGSLALLFALSGYLDTNPGKIFSSANPSRPEIIRYLGNALPDAMRLWQPVLPLELAVASTGSDIVELNWKRLGDEAVLLANTRDGQRLPQTLEGGKLKFSDESLLAAVVRLDSKTAVKSHELLSDYDSYYYPRHHQSPLEKPLPVVLVKLADDAQTRLYLDPQDGKLLTKLDSSARVFRWLYSALHHWDFGWFYYRPVWDIWMLTWISFGLVLGASALVLGWRRLKKTVVPKKRQDSETVISRYFFPMRGFNTWLKGRAFLN